jgi:hypothetical protein
MVNQPVFLSLARSSQAMDRFYHTHPVGRPIETVLLLDETQSTYKNEIHNQSTSNDCYA